MLYLVNTFIWCRNMDTKVTFDKLEAFEMWLYRRMLRKSWKEHKTNADVLHKMKTKRSLLNTIKQRKCQYFGYIIRGNGVQRLLMEGRINCRRGWGRPRAMWTDNIPRRTSVRHQNDRLFESNTNCKLCGKMAEVQAHAQCIPDSV